VDGENGFAAHCRLPSLTAVLIFERFQHLRREGDHHHLADGFDAQGNRLNADANIVNSFYMPGVLLLKTGHFLPLFGTIFLFPASSTLPKQFHSFRREAG
jgi:hypothetical protein